MMRKWGLVLGCIFILQLLQLVFLFQERTSTQKGLVHPSKSDLMAVNPAREALEKEPAITGSNLTVRLLSTSPSREAEDFEVTAYSRRSEEGTADGITFLGLPVDVGIAAADPNVIPLGSVIWVEGYGYAFVADIGGKIKGKRVDVFIPNVSEALRFGRAMRKIKIIALPVYSPADQ